MRRLSWPLPFYTQDLLKRIPCKHASDSLLLACSRTVWKGVLGWMLSGLDWIRQHQIFIYLPGLGMCLLDAGTSKWPFQNIPSAALPKSKASSSPSDNGWQVGPPHDNLNLLMSVIMLKMTCKETVQWWQCRWYGVTTLVLKNNVKVKDWVPVLRKVQGDRAEKTGSLTPTSAIYLAT